MCGIVGVFSIGRMGPEVSGQVAVWSERLGARGPDGSGLANYAGASGGVGGRWSAVLAHRRLAVIDTSAAAAQPMVSACGRWAIIYNGELYNDADLRSELSGHWRFRTSSDTETVLAAVAAWGVDASRRLRGMYAFAALELATGRVILARDPMGMKPLFVSERVDDQGGAICFASDARIPAEWHGRGVVRPDLEGVASYLTTIRTTLGNRTLFDGVQTLTPGEWREYQPLGENLSRRVLRTAPSDVEAPAGDVRATLEDSVLRHLRSDVPVCCLLSGGLDSTIIATIARKHLGELHTYCAGARGPGIAGEDFEFAARAASLIGAKHTEVAVSRDLFVRRVPAMIAALGSPLTTPNEVAINEVARAMRADGKVVTLSGEGADELFAGYDQALAAAARHESKRPDAAIVDPVAHAADFWCSDHAWVGLDVLPYVLTPEAWYASRGGAGTREFIESAFAEIHGAGLASTHAHLRYQRMVNLEGLLRRLDSATMLASIEGRTPFADAAVCAVAESLAMDQKIEMITTEAGWTAGTPNQSKIALRRAFANDIPAEIFHRRKASFPLPFESWIEDLAPRLRASKLVGEIVRPEILEAIAQSPSANWRLAWPLVNIAVWAETLTGPVFSGPRPQGFIEASVESASPETRNTVQSDSGSAPSLR